MGSRSSKPSLTAPPSADFNTPWRKVDWTKTEQLKDELRGIQLNHPQLQHLRILLHGPVGAGKSCFINSLQSVFQGEIKAIAYEQSFAKKSCTRTYKTYRIITNNSETLPFIFNDVMGLEATEEDGMHPEDVVNAMLGHIKDGYKFNPTTPISAEDQGFIREPSLQDKVHCLVSVVPANSISRMEYGVISKMGIARENAKRLGIPHVVIMTKVDEDICPLVQKDLTQIYKSRKIKEKFRCGTAATDSAHP
uniref:G domain-containing protein n=1 Tax=Astyanax mexicanus TaxID=7994 RepID=W5L3F1_ASTMX